MAITYHAGRRIQGIATDRTGLSQGYDGGTVVSSTQSAGGGGAGGTATGTNNKDGGIGKANPIVGSTHGESSGGSYYLAGGGGGAGEASGTSTGGAGGAGNGGTTNAPSTTTTSGYGGGAGGGGNSGTNYPNGGSGVVILKFLTSGTSYSTTGTPNVDTSTANYTILTYTNTSASSFILSSGTPDVQYLVVAGGGSSKDNWGYSGGAGGGGFITGTMSSLSSATYTVTVGAGGIGAGGSTVPVAGGNSVFSTITSSGGGAGGNWLSNSGAGGDGGSGGGGQGNSGGNDVGGSTLSTTPALPSTSQVGSRFEETDTRKIYHYTYDWFLEGTTIPPWSFTDDLSSSTPWTSVGSGITVTGGEISMAGVAASGSNYLWRSLSHTLSDTLWTMEFDYKSTGQSGGSVFFPFGVKSSVSPLSPNSGDSLRLRDDTDNAYLGTLSATVGGADSGNTTSIAWTEGSFYYPRIGRTSSTTMKYQLFSDSARTNQVGSTLTATISSSITGLDTLVCGGGDGGGGTSTGKISNIYISESDLFT